MMTVGVGDRVARLHVEHHLPHHGAQGLVLALAGQDVERLHQRQAGVDHRGELTREDHDVTHGDLAHALAGRRPGLVDLDNGEPLPPQLGHGLVPVRRVNGRRLEFAVRRTGGIGERWHLSLRMCPRPCGP